MAKFISPPNSLMFYVYMLQSLKTKQLYIGSTNDLRRRISEHNSGKGGYTKKHYPYELVYCEAYKDETDARQREANLKLGKNALGQLKRRIKRSIKAN